MIRKIEVWKQTHEGTMEDAQSSFDALVARYNEEKAKKYKLKAQVEQLTNVLIKITKSSKFIEPMNSLVDEHVIKHAERVTSRDREMGEQMDKMLSQGTHLLSSTSKLISHEESVKFDLGATLNAFLEEMCTQENNSDAWMKLRDFFVDVLVDNDVIPSKKRYVQHKELLKHHMEFIEQPIKDLEGAKSLGEKIVKRITDKIDELPCDLFDHDHELLPLDSAI